MAGRGGYLNRVLSRHYGRHSRAAQARLIQRAAEQLSPHVIVPAQLDENMDEEPFRRLLQETMESCQWLTYHASVPLLDRRGFPDIAAVRPRLAGLPQDALYGLLYVELKKVGRYLEPDQRRWRDRLAPFESETVHWFLWRPVNWPEILTIIDDGRIVRV